MKLISRALRALQIVALGLGLVGATHAHTYPARQVTLISAASAGSQSDVLARILAEEIGRQWKQTVIVDNRPGASGFIAAEAATRAAPDGYTLFLGSAGIMAINPHFHPKLPYDAMNGFVPIAFAGSAPYVVVVPQGANLRSVDDLVKRARTTNAPLTFGSLGNGSTTHIAAAMLGKGAELKLTQVPYKGDSQVATDLMAGLIDFAVLPTVTVAPHVRAGKLRALGVTSLQRTQQMPDVPTMHELGFKGYEMTQWFGFYAPSSTPPAIVKAVSEAVMAASSRDSVRNRLTDLGIDSQPMDVATFSGFHRDQFTKWGGTMNALQIKLD
ncbi:tripartite tricarboxylate transporter substrate binding protein [soil metagenome]